jgi:hypothetical protein
MHRFEALAQKAQTEYQRQPGFKCVVVEGEPAIGLRYKFENEVSADRFKVFRELHNSYEPANANALIIEGGDVVEIWA